MKRKASSSDLRYGLATYQAKQRRTNVPMVAAGYVPVATRTVGRRINYVKSEMKYKDSNRLSTALADLSSTNANWAGTELDSDTSGSTNEACIAFPEEGAGETDRLGRQFYVDSIRIRGLINVPAQANQTATDASGIIRLVLYQDKLTAGIQAQGEQVIGIASGGGGGANASVMLFQEPANFGRFQVLKDKLIRLAQPTITYDGTNIEQGGYQIPFKLQYKFKTPVKVNMSGGNGDVSDVVDNSFHLIGGCSNVTLAPTISYIARVGFHD